MPVSGRYPPLGGGFLLLLGVAALTFGAALYLWGRPQGSYLWGRLLPGCWGSMGIGPAESPGWQGVGRLLGTLGGWLPSFFHVLAWSLITAGILAPRSKSALAGICLMWLLINAGFELGQKYALQAGSLLPSWPPAEPLMDLIRNFWAHGTYDSRDLIAAGLGAAAAYFILLICSGRKNPWSEDFKATAAR
ncbi:MAG: hypothetical protein WBG37_16355 [Desulfobacterales bacterium]